MRPPRRLPGSLPPRWVKLTVTGSSAEWWRALQDFRERGEAPSAIEPLANGSAGEVVILEADWRRFHTFATSLPGWAERDGTEQITADFGDEWAVA